MARRSAVRSAAGQVAGGVTVLAGGAPARNSSASGLLLLLIGVIGLSLFLSGKLGSVLAWLTGTPLNPATSVAPGVGTGTAADRPGGAGGGGGARRI